MPGGSLTTLGSLQRDSPAGEPESLRSGFGDQSIGQSLASLERASPQEFEVRKSYEESRPPVKRAWRPRGGHPVNG